jgi:hypothetical protein
VTGPYRNALNHNPDVIPFLVFIDVNTPPTPDVEIFEKPWAKEILENRKKILVNKPDNPDPCTAIVYTNYSYHYQTEEEAKANEAITVLPNYPRYKVNESFLKKLQLTIQNYSYVPNIEYDGTVKA